MMSLGERRTRRFEEMRKWKKNQNIIIIIIKIIIIISIRLDLVVMTPSMMNHGLLKLK
jgi:hypothetical protein